MLAQPPTLTSNSSTYQRVYPYKHAYTQGNSEQLPSCSSVLCTHSNENTSCRKIHFTHHTVSFPSLLVMSAFACYSTFILVPFLSVSPHAFQLIQLLCLLSACISFSLFHLMFLYLHCVQCCWKFLADRNKR